MKIVLEVPDRVWGKLADLADKREVKVADLLVEAITGMLPGAPTPKPWVPRTPHKPLTAEQESDLRALHALNYSDGAIAKRIGVSKYRVRSAMVRFGLTKLYGTPATAAARARKSEGETR